MIDIYMHFTALIFILLHLCHFKYLGLFILFLSLPLFCYKAILKLGLFYYKNKFALMFL
jgi:hypothetical protein